MDVLGGYVEDVAADAEAFLLLEFDHADVVGDLFLLGDGRVHRVTDDHVGIYEAAAADPGPTVLQGGTLGAHGHGQVPEQAAAGHCWMRNSPASVPSQNPRS